MKVFIDTNILISAALFPNSIPYRAYIKAVKYPNRGMICKQNLVELRRVFNRKFPDKLQSMESFLAVALISLELVQTPAAPELKEGQVRDVKDRPILRSAIKARADVMISGDKDFLESGISHPMILTAAQFVLGEKNASCEDERQV